MRRCFFHEGVITEDGPVNPGVKGNLTALEILHPSYGWNNFFRSCYSNLYLFSSYLSKYSN